MSDGDIIKGTLSRFYLQAPFQENNTSPLDHTAISATFQGFFSSLLKDASGNYENICFNGKTPAWTCTTGTFQTEQSKGVEFITANLCPHVSLCPKDFKMIKYVFHFSPFHHVLQRLHSLLLFKHQVTTVYMTCHPWNKIVSNKS